MGFSPRPRIKINTKIKFVAGSAVMATFMGAFRPIMLVGMAPQTKAGEWALSMGVITPAI